jgi:H+/Cl- antiporter ClcA
MSEGDVPPGSPPIAPGRICDRCGLESPGPKCVWCGHVHDDADAAGAVQASRREQLVLRREGHARRKWLADNGHPAFMTCPACGRWSRFGLCEWCDFNMADEVAVAAHESHRRHGREHRSARRASLRARLRPPGRARRTAGVVSGADGAVAGQQVFMTCPSCHQWSSAPVCDWCDFDTSDSEAVAHIAEQDRFIRRRWHHRFRLFYSAIRGLAHLDIEEQGRIVAHLVKWIVLGAVVGVLAGLSSALFLATLNWVTDIRIDHPWLLWLLPFAGLAIGLVYHYGGGDAVAGNNLILDEIHAPKSWIPRRMAPLVYLGTEVTHLFGGSAGREGTALQMSGSLTDWFSRIARLSAEDRRIMLIAALAGGFGAVFGVPVAGFVFALEVQSIGRMRYDALVPAVAASLVGDLVVRGLGVTHTPVPAIADIELSAALVGKVVVAGLAFGLTALFFAELAHGIRRVFSVWSVWPPLRPFIGGFAVIGLTYLVGNRDYNGLSLPLITASLAGGAGVVAFAFAWKFLFTAVTLGSGFQGGEVTPLFVIGATLGVTMGHVLGVDPQLMAAIGLVAVFAGAANVPVACAVMGAELFGTGPFVLFAVACVVSYVFSSHRGIYPSQRVSIPKAADLLGLDDPAPDTTVHSLAQHRRHWLPAQRVTAKGSAAVRDDEAAS